MTRNHLQEVHQKTGELITMCNRLLVAVVLLGTLFCLMMLSGFKLLQNPEQILTNQAFSMNYLESAQNETIRKTGGLEGEAMRDPNWDGIVAGGSLGMTIGSGIPFVGAYIGPLMGAVVGYRMDARI